MSGDLLARIESDRRRYDDEREANRQRFPEAMALADPLREAGLAPKLKYARNAAGEEIGRMPKPEGLAVDGDKYADLPNYLARLAAMAPKNWDDPRAYNARASRCIKPNPWRFEE